MPSGNDFCLARTGYGRVRMSALGQKLPWPPPSTRMVILSRRGYPLWFKKLLYPPDTPSHTVSNATEEFPLHRIVKEFR